MKADGEFGSGGGREPEDLRTILKEWKAPGPPPEIEEDLRRAFRRRRSKSRRVVWLAVAACLALVLVNQVKTPARPVPPAGAERPALSLTSAPPSLGAEPDRVETRGPAHGSPARARRALTVPMAADVVVVEPGQAALLAQLARDLRGKRCVPPVAAAPQIVAAPLGVRPEPILEAPSRDAFPTHRTEWKRIETEWPFVYRSL
jgi:hypothetical protein